jgi:phosphoserine phosphatase
LENEHRPAPAGDAASRALSARASEIALIAFDVDGTLVDHPRGKVIWELLNRRFAGDDSLNHSRYRDYKAGLIDYPTWVSLDVEGWIAGGATRAEIVEVVRELQPVDGALETLRLLKDRGYRLAIISGTLDVVLNEFFRDHPFDQVYTNRLHFDREDRLSGWEATPYDMDGKARALRDLAALYDLPLSRCAFVGDNVNDLGVARIAGFTVAFNPKVPELEEVAHVVVRSPSLEPVGDLFPGCR